MLHAPLLSVVVPCYNVSDYVGACLASVCTQIEAEDAASVELVVVNDGSKDDTLARIQAVQSAYPHLIFNIVDQNNGGLSAARNRGVAASRGDYIAFLDGDDVFLEGYFKAILPVLRQQKPDLVEFDAVRFVDDPTVPFKSSLYGRHLKKYQAASTDDVRRGVFDHGKWYVWSRVYKRSLVLAHPFKIGRYYEDIAFTPLAYLDARSIVSLQAVLYGYRVNPKSITAKNHFSHVTSVEQNIADLYDARSKNPLLIKILLINLLGLYLALKKKSADFTAAEMDHIHGFLDGTKKELRPFLDDPQVGWPLYLKMKLFEVFGA